MNSESIIAAVPAQGMSVLVGKINGREIEYSSLVVLSFVVTKDIESIPVVVDPDTGTGRIIFEAVPEIGTVAGYRIIAPEALELSQVELESFEIGLRAQYARHAAYEQDIESRRLRMAQRNSPEAKAARDVENQKIIAATNERLSAEREEEDSFAELLSVESR